MKLKLISSKSQTLLTQPSLYGFMANIEMKEDAKYWPTAADEALCCIYDRFICLEKSLNRNTNFSRDSHHTSITEAVILKELRLFAVH